ncbi:unnamed protein product [Rotaria sp. Silwood1]|nr:unnamed protein product [Rotaria sp. Silwood1]CAF3797474.1 unnamed protein product [Rotaria sp. Silwood1]CAF3860506.1 unnamed protein product [Rotaria sp. Silwood1]CAF4853023.1 unnamed protein product [Rotaria sp. Silwood1]CAF5127127.1 unnamed protein product [Rotaria sp. Silwood1]
MKNVSMKEESLSKNCNFVYDLAKDTLCEKRFTDLVTSLHSHIRISFTNVVDDYSILLELIHYSSFSVNDKNQTIPMMQTISTLNDHYSIYVNNVSKV